MAQAVGMDVGEPRLEVSPEPIRGALEDGLTKR